LTIREPFGVGIAYRSIFHEQLLVYRNSIDFVEIDAAQCLNAAQRFLLDRDGSRLHQAVIHFPCILKSSLLSIGSAEPLGDDASAKFHPLLNHLQTRTLSEELGFCRLGGYGDNGACLSLPYTAGAAKWVAQRYAEICTCLGLPVILAVRSLRPVRPGDWDLYTFVNRIVELCGCLLSLDIGDLLSDARASGVDPLSVFGRLPVENIVQLRVPLDSLDHPHLHDSVFDEVLEILEAGLAQTPTQIIVVEGNGNFSPFGRLIDRVELVRGVFHKYRQAESSKEERPAVSSAVGKSAALPLHSLEIEDSELEALRAYELRLLKSCSGSMTSTERQLAAACCARLDGIPIAELDALAQQHAGRTLRAAYLNDHYVAEQIVQWVVSDRHGH
jgi:uncharacterized protein